MAYIENIVIGTPIVEPCLMFAKDEIDWKRVEQEKLTLPKKDIYLRFW